MLDHYTIFLEGVLLALVKKCHSYTNLFIEITTSAWNSENTVSAILSCVSAGEAPLIPGVMMNSLLLQSQTVMKHFPGKSYLKPVAFLNMILTD